MSSIIIQHDISANFGAARDQGTRETCLSFAMSDAHAAVLGQPWSPLSCEHLFYQAKRRERTSVHEGCTIPGVQAALEIDGQAIESAWPYLAHLPSDLNLWVPPQGIGKLHRRCSTAKRATFQDVWDTVEGDNASVVAMTISNAFFKPDQNGVIDSNEPEELALRHSVIAVANGHLLSKRVILVRNSWGQSWGLTGYGWLTERYLSPRIKAEITIA